MSREPRGTAPHLEDERGTILPLTIGFGVIMTIMLVVVIDASQAWIYQRGLRSLADGASLAAANALDPAAVYDGDLDDGTVNLNEQVAATAVDEYLATVSGTGTGHAEGVECPVEVNGDEVTVTCTGTLTLPLVGSVTQGLATREMQSSATAQTWSVD